MIFICSSLLEEMEELICLDFSVQLILDTIGSFKFDKLVAANSTSAFSVVEARTYE